VSRWKTAALALAAGIAGDLCVYAFLMATDRAVGLPQKVRELEQKLQSLEEDTRLGIDELETSIAAMEESLMDHTDKCGGDPLDVSISNLRQELARKRHERNQGDYGAQGG
jgi:uncharacterized Fe-S cluster-containing radical SAM superfamily enzyme